MTVENLPPKGGADARTVRDLLREAATATLATLDHVSGHPFASLIQVATTQCAAPLFLISGLARHTQNLLADPRASILVDRRATAPGNPLAIERATLVGTARRLDEESAFHRLVARHPTAASYAGFADFGLWTLAIERAHLVAGFGRIREIAGAAVCLEPSSAAVSGLGEPDLLATLQNRLSPRHASTRLAGLDPEGIDIEVDGVLHRLALHPFAQTTPVALHERLEQALDKRLATTKG